MYEYGDKYTSAEKLEINHLQYLYKLLLYKNFLKSLVIFLKFDFLEIF
jgi:hypothetical protein